MNFTINAINQDGSVDVTFDVDGVQQNVSGCPLDSVDALNQFLYDYGVAYETGLNLTQAPQVSADVQALVGQSVNLTQTVDKTGVPVLSSTVSATPIQVAKPPIKVGGGVSG